MDSTERKQSIPFLYVRGTHYECGFEMGRTFKSLISSFLTTSKLLSEVLLPIYNSAEGRKTYEQTLKVVQENYPQYTKEVQGIADGAEVDFYKLMILHFEEILPNIANQHKNERETSGCSSVYMKNSKDSQEVLAHTEDAQKESLNNYYMVSQHVISDEPYGILQVKEEKFTSLCYPGLVAGYTMSYNCHGLVFSTNTLDVKRVLTSKMPRHFIMRELLTAKNYDEVIKIVKSSGFVGCADGFSVNLKLIGKNNKSDDFFNIEVGPTIANESQISVIKISGDGSFIHSNLFLRLDIPQTEDHNLQAARARYGKLIKFKQPKFVNDVINMLGDTSHQEYWVFRCKSEYGIRTVCLGIFDFIKLTWSLYKDNPKYNKPVAVLSLNIDQ